MNVLSWILRVGLLGFVLVRLAPVEHRVVLGPPHAVIADHDHVCVHTDLIHEVDEWKIQHSLELVREMGADTIVEFFPWAYIEPEPGRYNWFQADRIVRHAENQGVHIIARMGLVPDWARPDDSTMNYMSVSAMEGFANFVALFSERYAGRIEHVIIWNEPNLSFEWGFQAVDPERYVEMLAAVYPRVKAANPAMTVLGGALAPTLEPPGSPHGMHDLIYLERLYEAGGGNYFDALAIHNYGLTQPALAEPAPDQLNFRRAELLREIMTRYGDGDKPVYITETGWNDNVRWVYGVRPSQRVAYTLDALAWSAEEWPWVEQLCLWILRHPTPRGTHRDSFTLITPEFQRKPIYFAVQAYALGTDATGRGWLPPPDDEEDRS
jgi:hypothetical protein